MSVPGINTSAQTVFDTAIRKVGPGPSSQLGGISAPLQIRDQAEHAFGKPSSATYQATPTNPVTLGGGVPLVNSFDEQA
jgi:hypothetical protein